MSTATDNKYGVTCEGNTCTTQDGTRFTYDEATNTVIVSDGENTGSIPVSSTPDGMTNPIDLSEFGFNGYIDVPED